MATLTSAETSWLHWAALTSYPLLALDAQEVPCDIASATLIDLRGQRFLISAQHIDVSKGWVLAIGVVSGQVRYFRPDPWNFAQTRSFRRTTGDIAVSDLCICPIPSDINSEFQERTPIHVGDALPRHVFDIRDVAAPNSGQVYAFAGNVKPEIHGKDNFVTEPNVYPGLRFISEDRHVCRFRLPILHPGHYCFAGCSGAPIVDMNRNLVAIVSSGDESEGTIQGVSLRPYVDLVQALCDV